MKILVLVAGMSEPSNADLLADRFMEGLQSIGADVQKMYLRNMPLEHFSMKFYDPKTKPEPEFQTLQKAIETCDGMLMATPIWNFSVPGHLKNLIDRMGSFALDAQSRSIGTLGGKPVYLLYTGGTPMVAWTGLQRRTVSHMSVALRYFGCVIIGKHYEERCTPGKGKFGLVVDKRPASQEIVRNKGKRFGKVVAYKVKTGSLPPMQQLLLWFFQTAQKIKKKLGI